MSPDNPPRAQPITSGEGDLERRVLEAIRAIRFGSVEIVIHDSKVVQIERREKLRFELSPSRPPGR